MTMLDKRSTHMLEALVRQFIGTGEPVSSGWLYEHYDFGIKPAMIRLILKDLDDAGYLEQPNYSAGRLPTDRGLEFFASHVLAHTAEEEPADRTLVRSFERHDWPDLLDLISADLGVLGVARSEDEIYKSGLERLMERLEWRSRTEVMAVIRDFEELDERLGQLREEVASGEGVRIFIGRKSPVTRCEHLSVVSGEYDTEGERVWLFAIGPKRMNYQKAARVFKNLKGAARSEKLKDQNEK